MLGKTVAMRKVALTIIGVAPRGFIGETNGQQPDLWIPVRMQPSVIPGRDWLHDTPPSKAMWLNVFGRLKPGVTLAQAEGQANAVFQAGLESFYGAAALGERRREFLDQRLRIRPAARGASQMRYEFSDFAERVAGGGGRAAADRVREPGEPSAGARRGAKAGNRVAPLAGRKPRPPRAATGHGEPGACGMGGAAGLGSAWFLHGALVRMMAEADPRFHMSFALDPAGAGVRRWA